MNRNELKKCKDTLNEGKAWICFGNDLIKIKGFVEDAMGKDFHFSIERKKTVFGFENIVKPLNIQN